MDWSVLHFRYQGLSTNQTNIKNLDTARPKESNISNGISANSWLTDIGKNKPEMTKHCTVDLHAQCQRSIKERAISGSGLMGRRHYEQQNLTTADIFDGKDISPLIDIRSSSSPRNTEGVADEKLFQNEGCGKNGIEGRDGKRRGSRPRTSGAKTGIMKDFPKRPYTAPLFVKSSQPETEQPILIKRLFNSDPQPIEIPMEYNGKNGREKSFNRKRAGVSVWKASRECRPPENSKVLTYKEFEETLIQGGDMTSKKGKNYRIKQGYHSNKESCQNKQDELVVDSRKSVQKREIERSKIVNIVPRNRFEKSEPSMQRPLSSWRPLLYSAEHDIQHVAGCSYQCQGCFKACLASEDYLESTETAYKERNSRNSNKELILALKRNTKTISQEVKRERYCEELDEVGINKSPVFLNLKKLEKDLTAE